MNSGQKISFYSKKAHSGAAPIGMWFDRCRLPETVWNAFANSDVSGVHCRVALLFPEQPPKDWQPKAEKLGAYDIVYNGEYSGGDRLYHAVCSMPLRKAIEIAATPDVCAVRVLREEAQLKGTNIVTDTLRDLSDFYSDGGGRPEPRQPVRAASAVDTLTNG
jgi:hypothetical protein